MMNRLDKYYEPHPQQLLRRTHRALLMLPPPPLIDTGSATGNSRHSTWSSRGGSGNTTAAATGGGGGGGGASGFAALERGERIRPERGARRSHVQKMQWRASRWVTGFPRGAAGDAEEDDQFDTRVSSMTISDVSPRFAVKRILFLYENLQFREAANFINRLSHGTFKVILGDLPVDLFVESMPHSLSILEALYAKVFLSDGLDFSVKLLRPEGVVMQMVKFFSTQNAGVAGERDWEPAAPFVSSCKKLLKVIVLSDPKLKKLLQQRRRRLEKAIEGLGQHGLVGTTDETLTDLHDALRSEFQRVVETYKGALQKLEELSLGGAVAAGGVARGPAPVRASHQRQLSLRQPDIQERLIKNQTLLNVVEPARASCSLDILLGILQRRVDADKEALFQFTQLRKEAGGQVAPDSVVAPVLMRFSHGCDQVLDLMKEVAEDEDDSSDISGYHSDSDSAIMMSGNSPYVSKRARYNFLTRSVRSSSKSSARTSVLLSQQLSSSSGASSDHHSDPGASPPSPPGSLGPSPAASAPAAAAAPATVSVSNAHDDALRPRQLKLKKELQKLNSAGSSASCGAGSGAALPCCQSCQTRASLQVLPPGYERETAALRAEMEVLRAELGRANARVQALLDSERQLKDRLASVAAAPVSPCNGILLGGERLVHCYANLYSTARVDALDALDNLPPLKDADELKSKILFSVVVLAFRAAQSLLLLKKDHIRRVLHIPPPPQTPTGSLLRNQVPSEPAIAELEQSISMYLRRTVDNFDLSKSVEEVVSQIWATLYDYPCLKNCPGLVQYVKDAVRLAWSLVNQSPPYILEYEQRTLRKDVHVRFHTSNPDSDQIRTYLWPALLEGIGGPCVHKAVVIT